jgi:hypothetical protein
MQTITFKDFARLMDKRRVSIDDLCLELRGQFDSPRDFFDRVWLGCNADVSIPYRSVLRVFFRERALQALRDAGKSAISTREKIAKFRQQKAQRLLPPQHAPSL